MPKLCPQFCGEARFVELVFILLKFHRVFLPDEAIRLSLSLSDFKVFRKGVGKLCEEII